MDESASESMTELNAEFSTEFDTALDSVLDSGLGTIYSAASAQVRQHGQVIYSAGGGRLDPDGRREVGEAVRSDTFFDLASLTKLFTATAFFRLIDAGKVSLETSVSAVLPAFSGLRPIRPYPDPLNTGKWIEVVPRTEATVDAGAITFRQILTHSSGLPAWLNLRDASDNAARLALCLETPFAYLPGTQVIYSDVGFILLGAAIARLTEKPLAEAMQTLVLEPLKLAAHYRPVADYQGKAQLNVAPTEFCAWRKRRIVGEVHDENAASFGGVSGHAGLFGTAADVAALGQVYLENGAGLISEPLAREAVKLQIGDRGLGWMRRTSDISSSGRYFSPDSYGHTGFTGTSLWIDPTRGLVCALLTNRVFYGRDGDPVYEFRRTFHDTLIESLNKVRTG